MVEKDSSYGNDYVLSMDDITHQSDVWVLDFEAYYHICSYRELFSSNCQTDGGSVHMTNGAVCKVIAIGSVRFKNHDGKTCTLNEVRHVPRITMNLISLNLLHKKSFSFKGEGGDLCVYKDLKVLFKGIKDNTLYVLQGSAITGYFLSIIDDYSRMICIFVMKHKSDAFGKFKEWKTLMENQKEKKMKKLRTDDGLEFCSSEFDEFCKDQGIARHHIVRGTPQQNETKEQELEESEEDIPLEELVHESFAARRTLRDKKLPTRLKKDYLVGYVLQVAENVEDKPSTYRAAITCSESAQWIAAMEKGMESLSKNSTWELNIKDIRELKSSLNAEFEMKDLGIAWKILEVEIYRDREISKLFLSQKRYIRKILHRFGMQTAKSKDTPMESNIKLGMYTIQTEE
ncbi:hypothetical protein AXG93_40s1190 [Marchantia polymorpha subsp. ruderalis]|uniref:Integrase catalytic domain-containing protein n=1 Tax=Marchantia polymorpha subsp. ruderalis TaxID=1480154 RepID=A0A176WD89_MARPO|nr:hypothetical protein AXG93_40s1190 [Marchantia polymorpha subsp. ruderalis]